MELTDNQQRTLTAVSRDNPRTPMEIANVLVTSSRSVQHALHKLEALGYVRKHGEADNRRGAQYVKVKDYVDSKRNRTDRQTVLVCNSSASSSVDPHMMAVTMPRMPWA